MFNIRFIILIIFCYIVQCTSHIAFGQEAGAQISTDVLPLKGGKKVAGAPSDRQHFDTSTIQEFKNLATQNFDNLTTQQLNSAPLAPCGDMGGENGWGTWQAYDGYHQFGGSPNPTFFGAIAPSAPRFNITSGAGMIPCTVGAGGPPVPVVAPGFGTASIQLGAPNVNGLNGTCNNSPFPPPGSGAAGNGCSEKLVYSLTVTPQDTNFIYAYALVLENPNGGHLLSEAPFAEIYMLDQNGLTVPCSRRKYTADLNGGVGPGFYAASCAGSVNTGFPPNGMIVSYKPWTFEGVNLSAYLGQTLTVIITNSDCALGGHFCYSYWDFRCSSFNTPPIPYCVGQQVSITAPSDPTITYTYQWYQNGNPYTGAPGSTSQTITPFPQPGDIFSVQINQPSGCKFYVTYLLQPMSVTPNFTFTGACGVTNFTDASATPNGSPIVAWNWSFPGGTPVSSTLQNPSVTYPAGTYSVTLIATSQGGCVNTIVQQVVIGGMPTAIVNSTPPCLGSAVTLTDGSIPSFGDPLTSWNWTMTSGNPATATSQNTSVTYSNAGAYNVTLIVTTQSGCKDTIVQQVIVYTPPVALFSGSGTGCTPLCVTNYLNSSSSADGNITNWAWSFQGGTPSSYNSTTAPGNPPANPGICYFTAGAFGASLIVTTTYGCKDTLTITPIVTTLSQPNADFCIDQNPVPATDPTFSFCNLWSSDATQWLWDFGDGTTFSGNGSLNTDPIHSYNASVSGNNFYSFNVCLRVENQYGCWDTICKTVELLPEFTFYIPNTFTPNNDFTNELFFGQGVGVKDYTIWIFDRWGNLIWDCNSSYAASNPKYLMDAAATPCKWDGKVVKGGADMSGGSKQLVQEDVYVWKVKLTDVFDQKHTYIGNVNVVR